MGLIRQGHVHPDCGPGHGYGHRPRQPGYGMGPVSLLVQASSGAGLPLSYSATGLPAGARHCPELGSDQRHGQREWRQLRGQGDRERRHVLKLGHVHLDGQAVGCHV